MPEKDGVCTGFTADIRNDKADHVSAASVVFRVTGARTSTRVAR